MGFEPLLSSNPTQPLLFLTGLERRAGEHTPPIVCRPILTIICHRQERAWYDSHRASLVPEPDAETVVNDIKRGTAPSRARDRGLTVRHIQAFLNASIWSGFGDGENVWLWDALR